MNSQLSLMQFLCGIEIFKDFTLLHTPKVLQQRSTLQLSKTTRQVVVQYVQPGQYQNNSPKDQESSPIRNLG